MNKQLRNTKVNESSVKETTFQDLFYSAHKMALRHGRIGNHEPADIAQNALLRWLERGPNSRPIYNSMGWLQRTVCSTAIDAGRANVRENKYLIIDNGLNGDLCERTAEIGCMGMIAKTGVELESDGPDMDTMKKVLDGLTPVLQTVLSLYSEGYSYREIAKITGANIGTVRSRLHHARRQAKELLRIHHVK